MSRHCDVCGRGAMSGNTVSHSNRRGRRRWNVNLQAIKAVVDGTVKRLSVCTRCLRSGRVQRAT